MNQTVKLMSALIMGCISMPALATESGDTLVVEKPNRVKIETRNDQQRIVVIGSKEDKAFLYTQRIALKDSSDVKKSIENARDFNKVVIKKNGKSTKWSSSAHVFLGLNVMTDVPDGYKFKTWFSPEIGVALMADWHPFGKKNEWSVGLGVDFKHYSNSSSSYWAKGPNAANPALPNGAGESDRSTSINVFSLQVPLMYTHYFDNACKWSLSLGGILNFNTYAIANRSFTIGQEDYDINLHYIGQRPFTVDAFLKFDAPNIPPVYCKYGLMEFFKDNRGPKMHQLTFGIFLE